MKKTTSAKKPDLDRHNDDPFELRSPDEMLRELEPLIHIYGNRVVCDTDKRGYPTPQNRNPAELVVDASEGFIPLWERNETLRWQFQERSLQAFRNPEAARTATRQLFADAVIAWGDAAPIQFTQSNNAWDFEIAFRSQDRCNNDGGCVLASAFFPGSARETLVVYPKFFTQTRQERLETFIHEIGHIFGLRHFFARISEADAPSELFGSQDAFTIMNYGTQSVLTDRDKSDLQELYRLVWSGQLTKISRTPIRFFRPFHNSGRLQ
jgi:Matrixin